MNNYDLKKTHGGWVLKQQDGDLEEKFAGTKEEAVRRASKLMQGQTGSLKIHNLDGTIEEERTFPRSDDPAESEG